MEVSMEVLVQSEILFVDEALSPIAYLDEEGGQSAIDEALQDPPTEEELFNPLLLGSDAAEVRGGGGVLGDQGAPGGAGEHADGHDGSVAGQQEAVVAGRIGHDSPSLDSTWRIIVGGSTGSGPNR